MSNQELKQRARAQLGNSLFSNTWMIALLVCFLTSAISGAAGSIIPGIGALLVFGAISYGCDRVFLRQARDGQAMDIGELFTGFTTCFGDTFVLGFLSSLFIALWSLLLVIPGIVKAYSWSMIYCVKVDHPEYTWRQCMDESAAMMNGHRMELFLLDLSFIGWYIVGALCLGLGTLWVMPYHQAARTQFYVALCSEPQIL